MTDPYRFGIDGTIPPLVAQRSPRAVDRADTKASATTIDEPPVRTVGTAGAFENLDALHREALRAAREWERYGYTDKADDWRTVAKWLEGIKR